MTDLEAIRAQSHDVWEGAAPGWQKKNDWLWEESLPVGEWLVDRLEVRPTDVILDLAAGPGDTGYLAARSLGEGGRLITSDFSAAMLAVAEKRARQLDVNAEFLELDATDMDLDDDSVDKVICRWGYMLMHDPAAALRETRRVLRSGGRLAFSTWMGPERNPWVTLVGMTLTQAGHPPQGDPFGPGGIFSMSDPDTVRTLTEAAGFEVDEVDQIEMNWHFDDYDDFWSFLMEVAGAVSVVLRTLDDATVATVRDDLRGNLAPLEKDGAYDFPAVALAVLAR